MNTATSSSLPLLTHRRAMRLFRAPGAHPRFLDSAADEAGAATAEYAIATMATVAPNWHT